MAILDWHFFTPETLERVFVIYVHKKELGWAEKMWRHLGRNGLTQYSTAYQYNAVLARLAVLARYWRCWDWQADYGGGDDPYYEYADWMEALPFIRSVPPFVVPPEAAQPSDQTAKASTEEILAQLIKRENEVVFDAVMRFYGEGAEFELALDLRRAAGVGDDFGSHVRFDEHVDDTEMQEQFFKEHGLSLKEFDAVSIIRNRFVF